MDGLSEYIYNLVKEANEEIKLSKFNNDLKQRHVDKAAEKVKLARWLKELKSYREEFEDDFK